MTIFKQCTKLSSINYTKSVCKYPKESSFVHQTGCTFWWRINGDWM